MTTSRSALTPAAVGPRMAALTAVVAVAVMFGVGLLAGRVVVVLAGWTGPLASGVAFGTAGAAALYSAAGSVRRMRRARRRRAAAS